jgi:hypothetical protein
MFHLICQDRNEKIYLINEFINGNISFYKISTEIFISIINSDHVLIIMDDLINMCNKFSVIRENEVQQQNILETVEYNYNAIDDSIIDNLTEMIAN